MLRTRWWCSCEIVGGKCGVKLEDMGLMRKRGKIGVCGGGQMVRGVGRGGE